MLSKVFGYWKGVQEEGRLHSFDLLVLGEFSRKIIRDNQCCPKRKAKEHIQDHQQAIIFFGKDRILICDWENQRKREADLDQNKGCASLQMWSKAKIQGFS